MGLNRRGASPGAPGLGILISNRVEVRGGESGIVRCRVIRQVSYIVFRSCDVIS